MSSSNQAITPASSVRPSFWNRWTRLSSSSTSTVSSTPNTNKPTAEDVFKTPSPIHCHHQQGESSDEHSEADLDSLLVTPHDPPHHRDPMMNPRTNQIHHTSHFPPSPTLLLSSPSYYSKRIRPARASSLLMSSTSIIPSPPSETRQLTEEPSIRTRSSHDTDRERYPVDHRHSDLLASFLKNNGGYMDDSESEDDDDDRSIVMRPIMNHFPLTKPRSIFQRSEPRFIPGSLPLPHHRSRSLHQSPRAHSSTPVSFGSQNRIERTTSEQSKYSMGGRTIVDRLTDPERRTKFAPVVDHPNHPVLTRPEQTERPRRPNGHRPFRSLVLGEDDLLRVL